MNRLVSNSFADPQGQQAQHLPKLRAMMTQPCAGVGVGLTCRSLLRSAVAEGFDVDLFTSRSDDDTPEPFNLHSFTPGALRHLPYRLTRHLSVDRLHQSYLRAITSDQIAYLWPSVPLPIYEALATRGIRIVTEAINTRMERAKAVLDHAYEQLGLPPKHTITEARVADQKARHDLCTAIFSPSPATDASFAGTGLGSRLVPSSYGTWVPAHLPTQPRHHKSAPVTFLFIGMTGIRKGLHHLLAAWRDAPANAHLRIVGFAEPSLRRLFADVFARPNVSCVGFRADVFSEYLRADAFILPSLEEGDPIVTYEAAAFGLPVLASNAGAGRFGAETGAVDAFDTSDIESLCDRIAKFTASEEQRRHWGEIARAASFNYDWSVVAPRNYAKLAEFLSI